MDADLGAFVALVGAALAVGIACGLATRLLSRRGGAPLG
jgi:hypothetical protein